MPLFKHKSPSVGDELKHIAFIMDGNGRWATRRGMPRYMGHRSGAANFKKIVRHCGDIGINYVTVYALSTENLSRPEREVREIMTLLDDYIAEGESDNKKNNIEYAFLGDLAAISPELEQKARRLEALTRGNSLRLNIALGYGGRAEIVRAFNSLLDKGVKQATEEDIEAELYTAGMPDPDLIVRTGCEKRLSNFLTWQSIYSELYFTDILWPDFSVKDVDEAVADFQKRKRRYGKI